MNLKDITPGQTFVYMGKAYAKIGEVEGKHQIVRISEKLGIFGQAMFQWDGPYAYKGTTHVIPCGFSLQAIKDGDK